MDDRCGSRTDTFPVFKIFHRYQSIVFLAVAMGHGHWDSSRLMNCSSRTTMHEGMKSTDIDNKQTLQALTFNDGEFYFNFINKRLAS